MKHTNQIVCAVIISIITTFGIAEEPAKLRQLRFAFEVALEQKHKPLKEFDEKYRMQLRTLEEQMQTAGELKKLLIVRMPLDGIGAIATEPKRLAGNVQTNGDYTICMEMFESGASIGFRGKGWIVLL